MRKPAIPGLFSFCLLAVTGWPPISAGLVELEMADDLPAVVDLMEGGAPEENSALQDRVEQVLSGGS